MSTDDASDGPAPARQYLSAEGVIGEMCRFGAERVLTLSWLQTLVLAVVAGALITGGALLSVLVSAGVGASGSERLLQGVGFSAGFLFVILAHAVLFTEANVVLPAVLLRGDPQATAARIGRFWVLAWVGNLAGAVVVGFLIGVAQQYGPEVREPLAEVVEHKMRYREAGGVASWGRVVLSGMLANWLVGMAAFFAVMGRTIVGKYVPIVLAVTMFVAAGFQHSPANMGYFALVTPLGEGPGWAAALAWSIVPAGIGNILGGALLVAWPMWFALDRQSRSELTDEIG